MHLLTNVDNFEIPPLLVILLWKKLGIDEENIWKVVVKV